MEIFEVFPGIQITNDLCILVKSHMILALADLHIGIESAMEQNGFFVPRMQMKTMKNSLQRIIDKYSPEQIIVVGDLKHEFSRNLEQEWDEVRLVLSFLKDRSRVILIRGNHDNYLKTIASKLKIDMVNKLEIGGITFSHGHLYAEQRPLIIGHEHPSVKLLDRVGAAIKLPCFVHLKDERILVMPAFSPLATGVDIVRADPSECLSPILQKANLSSAEIYACSDVGLLKLGTVETIRSLTV
ncbi:MAG: metallophosphoesterase [Methanomassiliicoccales archaeon]